MNRRAAFITVLSQSEIAYLLRDDFTDTVAAGSVNTTLATPTGGARVVVDAENKLSIGSGVASIAGGKATPAVGDPGIWWGAQTRAAGLIGIFRLTPTHTNTIFHCGFDSDQTGATLDGFRVNSDGAIRAMVNGTAVVIGVPYTAALQDLIVILRASGLFLFVHKDTPYPEMIWYDTVGNTATVYPGLANFSETLTMDFVRVPQTLWLPTPQISDGFSAAASDGAGHAETSGLGAGGSGKAWTNRLGTWGVAAGARACSELGVGDLGICTASLTSADVYGEVALTRSAGNLGLIVRYVDNSNYVYAYHTGTQVTLRKIVGGVDSQVMALTNATYAAGAPLRIWCKGTTFRTYYNKVKVGGDQTISDAALQSGTGVGLYTSNTGNTFDNLFVYGEGSGGEHGHLNNFFSGSAGKFFPVGDSKTVGNNDDPGGDGYPTLLRESLKAATGYFWHEYPTRFALGNYTVADMLAYVTANLNNAIGTPEHILMNLGSNELSGMPAEATWKADYRALIALFHNKWPSAKIYLAKPVRLEGPPPSTPLASVATLHGWVDALVAEQSYLYEGIDETALEGGDGYATNLADNTHPNHTGYVAVAALWKAAMGYA